MLPRILEPEVMDTPQEARDYDAMDHSAVNRVFVDDFLTIWNSSNPILDLGTGTAQIPIALCRQESRAQVVAIDLSEQMLRVARENVERAGLAERITFQRVDAKGLPFSEGAFGAIISNSIVHHIPEPATVLAEVVRVAAPGAVLFLRDLLRPRDELTLLRLVATYAGDANEHQKQMFADSLHAALMLDEIRQLVMALGFAPEMVQPTTDRHWTWAAKNSL